MPSSCEIVFVNFEIDFINFEIDFINFEIVFGNIESDSNLENELSQVWQVVHCKDVVQEEIWDKKCQLRFCIIQKKPREHRGTEATAYIIFDQQDHNQHPLPS